MEFAAVSRGVMIYFSKFIFMCMHFFVNMSEQKQKASISTDVEITS